MEKRNVIEPGRSPEEQGIKLADIVDEGVQAFMLKTGIAPVDKPKENCDDRPLQ